MWKPRVTEKISEWLVMFVWGAILINGILVAFASVWFVAKCTWFGCRFINRVLFSSNW